MLDECDLAARLLPAHFSELVGKHVHGSVDVVADIEHECEADPVGQTREFESTDGSMSIQWCEACEWHSVEERAVS